MSLLEAWSHLSKQAPLTASLALVGLGVSVLTSVGAALIGFRCPAEPWARAARWIALGVVLATFVGHLSAIAVERADWIRALSSGQAGATNLEPAWQSGIAVLLCVALPSTFVAWASSVASAHRGFALGGAAISFAVGAVGGVVVLGLHEVSTSSSPAGTAAEVLDRLVLLRWIPAAVAGAVGAALVLRGVRLRPQSPPSGEDQNRLALAVALAVFGVGALVFFHTRAHAADRDVRESLRSDPIPEGVAFSRLPPRRPPSSPLGWTSIAFDPGDRAPLVVVLAADRFTLDGVEAGAQEIGRRLSSRRRRWAERHPRIPFDASVVVAAPADARTEQIAPVLRESYSAGFPAVRVLLADRRLVHTHTFGTVTRRRLYATDFYMRGAGEHLDRAPRTLPSRWGPSSRRSVPGATTIGSLSYTVRANA